MYKDFYHVPKAEITPLKIMMAIMTVFIFFVLPVQIISFFQDNPNELNRLVAEVTNQEYIPQIPAQATGQVAGASTSINSNKTIFTNIEQQLAKINLKDSSTQYSLLGGGLVLVSMTVLIYLITTEKNKNHNESYELQYKNNWL